MASKVAEKFASYPDDVRDSIEKIRALILAVAKEDQLGEIEETLKWGEPSYLVKHGSTIRIDWKSKYPSRYYVYFNCKTRLVETFKEVYGSLFQYEGNRAIVFELDNDVPVEPLKHCIALSLQYHKIKHLPLLGA